MITFASTSQNWKTIYLFIYLFIFIKKLCHIDALFWNLPIYLLSFFLKYEYWVIDLIMSLYNFIFLGRHLRFCIVRFHITMKCKKQFIWLIFLNEICLIKIEIISFNSFTSYYNEFWKIMQELIF
jgi:hypothetical protein